MTILNDVYEVADRVREHLLAFPTHFDFLFQGEPSPERLFGQLVSMYNRQSFISLHICLELGHVVPAGQIARALLEESIRWEWITDESETRGATHVGELRRNLRNINEACDALGVDGTLFLDPSPFWTTDNLRPFEGGKGFPNIPRMLQDIEEHGRAAFEATGEDYPLRIHHQLYVYYRVLSQITHTSLLGMTATMQPGDAPKEISVASKLPDAFMALLLHVGVASVINVCVKTGEFYIEDAASAEFVRKWSLAAKGLGGEMAEKASAIHGLAVA